MPPEELDAQVADGQAGGEFQIFTSLLHRGGGWSANHALYLTRPSRPGCNPRVPPAGSLSWWLDCSRIQPAAQESRCHPDNSPSMIQPEPHMNLAGTMQLNLWGARPRRARSPFQLHRSGLGLHHSSFVISPRVRAA